MDKIKTVKIKNEDGTVSEESYSISVDAINVDMSNGKDLQDTVGNIDIDEDGNIASQLNNLNDNIKKKVYYFDTVADMKNANLKNGDMAITLGYYEVNDGGGAEYRVLNNNNNNNYYEELNNNFKAELIIRNNYIYILQVGAKGDGITDNSEILQKIFNNYKYIYINKGEYYFSDTLTIQSDVVIRGQGILKGNINISGEIGEDISYTTLEINKINTNHIFNVGDLLLVFYEESEDKTKNKRQIVTTSSKDGKLSNNLCNYNNNYSINLINSIKNIKIFDITIIGNIIISYAQNIYLDKITLKSGTISIKSSYNINILNSIFELGNNNRIDGNSGSSNLIFKNLIFSGGNTPSDNGALKLNEVFYSNIDKCNFGTPNINIPGYTGKFHAIMIDGNFAENNYPLNHTQYININNIFIANDYTNALFITLGKNININNFSGNDIHLKYCNSINIDNSIINTLYNEIENINLNFEKSNINTITLGTRKNMNFINCIINDIALAKDTNNNNFINCKINKLRNTYVSADSAKNIHFENCEIFETCQLGGINNCTGLIKSHVFVQVNQLNNSNVSILIVDNNNTTYNLSLQNCNNSKIFYQILESALTNTPVNNLVNGFSNKIESINLVMSNNPNNNTTQAILKANAIPTTGYHYRGEIILNSAPSSNGKIGWVCVISGEPGTWKTFGNIEN